MRFSEFWLREYVNPPVSTDQLVAQLTMAGLEVDAVEPAAPEFSGVVVAEVVSVESHPNADKLRVCQVSVGSDQPLQIVCGAPNVRLGMKAPLATVGAIMPGDFKIKKAKLRGVESFGMLCSARELGLAESSDGLWELPQDAPVGQDLRDYLQLNDTVIEVDLTPNRADCLSVEGIARETAVINRMDWQPPAVEAVLPGCDDKWGVVIDEAAAHSCPRYLGRLIQGIDPEAETPMWMQERLRRSGIRSLGPVVDVTNYVLLELGQPLHAFDANRLRGGITVRIARRGEQLALLNGQEIELQGNELIIADQERPLALAGVMGGEDSAVTQDTRNIFLECAFFAPEAIMGKARQHGLHTDSSHRFERGVDPQLPPRALERATRLLVDIVGGQPGPVVEVNEPEHLPQLNPVRLRAGRVKTVLGIEFRVQDIVDILQRLGMKVEPQEAGRWQVVPPSFRFDISLEEDLIEELARIHGYDSLPVQVPLLPAELRGAPEETLPLARILEVLSDRGYQEAITYSFVDAGLQRKITPDIEPIPLANPLSSEMGVMRTSLWSGLLQAVRHNLNRQHRRVRLFESGLCFATVEGETVQQRRLAAVAIGPVLPDQWGEPERSVDFYDLKGDLEALLDLTGQAERIRFQADKHPALHPGQCARIFDTEHQQSCGWLGMLHPSLGKELGFDDNVFLFETDLSILERRRLPEFQPLSRQPLVRRDLALVIPESVPAQSLLEQVEQLVGGWLVDLVLFDVYQGEGLGEGEKSLGFRLVIQDRERTLTDDEVERLVEKVIESLNQTFGARLRE